MCAGRHRTRNAGVGGTGVAPPAADVGGLSQFGAGEDGEAAVGGEEDAGGREIGAEPLGADLEGEVGRWRCSRTSGRASSGGLHGIWNAMARVPHCDVHRASNGEPRGEFPMRAGDDSRGEKTERRRDGEIERNGRWSRWLRGAIWVFKRVATTRLCAVRRHRTRGVEVGGRGWRHLACRMVEFPVAIVNLAKNLYAQTSEIPEHAHVPAFHRRSRPRDQQRSHSRHPIAS